MSTLKPETVKQIENRADKEHPFIAITHNEIGIIKRVREAYTAGATAFALLLQQAEQENDRLRGKMEAICAYNPDLLASKERIIREMKSIATAALNFKP